jgi:hypothetical protein
MPVISNQNRRTGQGGMSWYGKTTVGASRFYCLHCSTAKPQQIGHDYIGGNFDITSNDRKSPKSYDIEILSKGNREFNENRIEVDGRC